MRYGNSSAAQPGIGAQDGHEQLIMPPAIPAERLAQTTLMAEATFLVDPLGAEVEVVD